MFLGLSLSLIIPPSVDFKISLGKRLCEKRIGYLQVVVFIENFWNFKVIPNKKIILTSV
jgi:hypothetical protein